MDVAAISWREEGLISVASCTAKGVVAILRVEPDPRSDDPMRGVYRWEVTVDDVVESGRAYTPRTARADAAAALNAIERRSQLLLVWSTLGCVACTTAALAWMAV